MKIHKVPYKVTIGSNTVIVEDKRGKTLFSYGKAVAHKPLEGAVVLSHMWSYSITTQGHVLDFLELKRQDLVSDIADGKVEMGLESF